MRVFTAFAIVGVFIATVPGLAQQAGTRTAEENPPARVEAPARGCGFLGIYPTNIGRRTAETLGLSDRRGAIVEGVVKQTGAERAGILEKDVIIAFNGESIQNEAHLRRLILAQTPGATVRLDLLRNGTALVVNAEISARSRYYGGPDCNAIEQERREQIERHRDAVRDLDISSVERELEDARRQINSSVSEVRLERSLASGYDATTGLALQRMSPQLAKYFNTGTGSGALVAEVAEGSPALKAGMQAGDVIVGINGADVAGPMQAVEAIMADRDGTVELQIVRDAERRTVRVRTGAEPAPVQAAPRQSPGSTPDLGNRVTPQRELMRLVGGQDLQ